VTKLKKYKTKTHKSTAKRFRVTGSGKVVRTAQGKSHFRRRRSSRLKRKLDKLIGVDSAKISRKIKRLAPYLGKYRANPGS
jgi:large subunit ribosomal protein L35